MGVKVTSYDVRKAYKMIVSKQGTLIVQNGVVYEHGSGRALGPVADMLEGSNKELIYCKKSGATFPNTPDGKIAFQAYQDRKGFTNKPSEGEEQPASTIEQRKAEVAGRREKIKGK